MVASEPGECFRIAAGYGLGSQHGMSGRAVLTLGREEVEVVDVDHWGADSLYYTTLTSTGYALVVAPESTLVSLRLDRRPLGAPRRRWLLTLLSSYAGAGAGALIADDESEGPTTREYVGAFGGLAIGFAVGLVASEWVTGLVRREEVCEVEGR